MFLEKMVVVRSSPNPPLYTIFTDSYNTKLEHLYNSTEIKYFPGLTTLFQLVSLQTWIMESGLLGLVQIS